MTDLSLFALALLKLGMLCGFIPSIIFVCAAEAWRKAQRHERWAACLKQLVTVNSANLQTGRLFS